MLSLCERKCIKKQSITIISSTAVIHKPCCKTQGRGQQRCNILWDCLPTICQMKCASVISEYIVHQCLKPPLNVLFLISIVADYNSMRSCSDESPQLMIFPKYVLFLRLTVNYFQARRTFHRP